MADPRIGTAGWSVASIAADVAARGSHLERYATLFDAVEINSSFTEPHRAATYARWASSVPTDFRFAVKVPRAITHEKRLLGCEDAIARFADAVASLGDRLDPLLVQVPPSLAFDTAVAAPFFDALQAAIPAATVCEPRHGGWFAPTAEAFLAARRVARVAADPAIVPAAAEQGRDGLAHIRLHGAPRGDGPAARAGASSTTRPRAMPSVMP